MAHVNVFVGAETGLLKGVNFAEKSWNNVKSLSSVDRGQEICALCWGSDEEKEVCLGLRNQKVEVFDTNSSEVVKTYDCSGGTGTFKGLAKYDGKFVTCSESGLLKVWNEETNIDQENQTQIEAGADICCMRQNPTQRHLVATGGKENDLKIWDLSGSTTPIFTAKNVRNDCLELRVPVWVTDVAFSADNSTVFTCTRHSQVRVYDPRTSQRRPIREMKFLDHPLASMAIRPGHRNQVIVGTAQGHLGLLDLRSKGQVVQKYRGLAGGVHSVQCHQSADLVASCGLDRFLYVHNVTSQELVHKFYLKSRLNCLLMSAADPYTVPVKMEVDVPETEVTELPPPADDEDDKIWARLEDVAEPTKKPSKKRDKEKTKSKTAKRKHANKADEAHKMKREKKPRSDRKTKVVTEKSNGQRGNAHSDEHHHKKKKKNS